MKVYIAYGCLDYDGGAVVGVFSTREGAETALHDIKQSMDEKNIEEIELDAEIELWV